MPYPSIISQPGSASRNLQPITDALAPLVTETIQSNESRHSSSSTEKKLKGVKFLELASFPYTHIKSFAQRWQGAEWYGSCRDEGEIQQVLDEWTGVETPSSLHRPLKLDISIDQHWDQVVEGLEPKSEVEPISSLPFDGVIMLNLIHCVPLDYPEHIFRHLSPRGSHTQPLLDPGRGWIAAYGAFKNDDGSYKSPGDEKFDAEYIRSHHNSLGLRSIASITDVAEKWGFVEESRQTMAAGNMFVVWRVGTQ